MDSMQSMTQKRGRPAKSALDTLARIAADEEIAVPYRRIASAAVKQGVTWSRLSRLAGVDLSAMRRAFEAENPPVTSIRTYAKAIGLTEIAVRALCGTTTRREAIGELHVELINIHSLVHEQTDDELNNCDIISKIFDRMKMMSDDEIRLAGIRLILATHGLYEIERPHKHRNSKLDVLVAIFPSFLAEVEIREQDFETLDDNFDDIQHSLEMMGVTTAEQKRIFEILQPYRGPNQLFDEASESATSEAQRHSLLSRRLTQICEDSRTALKELDNDLVEPILLPGHAK